MKQIFKQAFSIKNIIIGGSITLLSNFVFVTYIYLLGYWINNIRANIDSDALVFTDWKDISCLKTGIKASLAFLSILLLYYVIAFIIMTSVFLVGFAILGISNSEAEGLGWLGVFIAIIIAQIFNLYFIISSPIIISKFVKQEDILAPLKFKANFKILKNNLSQTLITSLLILGLCILIIIGNIVFPFIGFYFAIILSKIIANYITKLDKKEIL